VLQVSSPHSLLYDPALHRLLHRLMCKVFRQLLGQLHRLGAKVIHANFNRIILATNKNSKADAEAYCSFVLNATQSHTPLFNFVEMRPVQFWRPLLFMDPYNYGGLVCSSPPAVESAPVERDLEELSGDEFRDRLFADLLSDQRDEQQADGDAQQQEGSVASHWTLAEYLPVRVRDQFLAVLSDFLQALHGGQISSDPVVAEEEAEKIVGRLGQRLFPITAEIQRNVSMDEAREHLRTLPGHSKSMDVHPAVMFVTTLCKVLALHAPAQTAVLRLRRNLFRLLKVAEFSNEAAWHDPSGSFLLRDVV
jgi:DNA polymerase epsilon subunit 1